MYFIYCNSIYIYNSIKYYKFFISPKQKWAFISEMVRCLYIYNINRERERVRMCVYTRCFCISISSSSNDTPHSSPNSPVAPLPAPPPSPTPHPSHSTPRFSSRASLCMRLAEVKNKQGTWYAMIVYNKNVFSLLLLVKNGYRF